jgi:hypothetical protein
MSLLCEAGSKYFPRILILCFSKTVLLICLHISVHSLGDVYYVLCMGTANGHIMDRSFFAGFG